jgi:hypothetical protein
LSAAGAAPSSDNTAMTDHRIVLFIDLTLIDLMLIDLTLIDLMLIDPTLIDLTPIDLTPIDLSLMLCPIPGLRFPVEAVE